MPHDTTSDTVASHTTAASKKATSCLITTVAQSHSLLFLFTPLHVAPSIAFSGPGLNAGNPVLKTYDFVSVKPLSQNEEAYDSFAKRRQLRRHLQLVEYLEEMMTRDLSPNMRELEAIIPSSQINVVLSNASAMSQTSTLDVEANTSADNARTDTLCENANVLAHQIENSSDESRGDDSITMVDYIPLLVAADETKVEIVSSVANNLEVMMDEDDKPVTKKNVSGREQLKESENETIALVDHIPVKQHDIKDNSSVETCMSLEEAGMRGLMHEEQSNVESKHTASVPFVPATLILASPNSTFCVLICFLLGIFRHIYLFTIAAFLIAEGNSEQSGGQQALKWASWGPNPLSASKLAPFAIGGHWPQFSLFTRLSHLLIDGGLLGGVKVELLKRPFQAREPRFHYEENGPYCLCFSCACSDSMLTFVLREQGGASGQGCILALG
ncbi:hypothetical protein D5086_002109 [Populus alba]|uniref:Uncharacterized protein n=1 Tax=Populus alba TaxID=43335 RepID=A0ACC4D1F2_POPAL